MSAPTSLAPWYVVFKDGNDDVKQLGPQIIYYQSTYSEDTDEFGQAYTFSPSKEGALILHNLASAARIAKSEGGMIRVLVTQEEAAEFARA